MTTKARVARYELPGKRWFVAVCEECRWFNGLGWKHIEQARLDRDKHNAERHDRGQAEVRSDDDG